MNLTSVDYDLLDQFDDGYAFVDDIEIGDDWLNRMDLDWQHMTENLAHCMMSLNAQTYDILATFNMNSFGEYHYAAVKIKLQNKQLM